MEGFRRGHEGKLDKTRQPMWIDKSMLNVVEMMITWNNIYNPTIRNEREGT